MPELPEVETTRAALGAAIEGKRVMAVEVARARMLRRQPNPDDFAARLARRTVRVVDRHGKFILTRLGAGLVWVTHLGMSGRVRLAYRTEAREPHTNVVVGFGGGLEFRLVDPRTFGFVAVLTPEEVAESSLGRLGPDAWTDLPPAARLGRRLAGRSAPLKALLLDQGILAGIGNIYADEALNRARISPHRPGGGLDGAELTRVRAAIRRTLGDALAHGGSSLDDLAYLLPDGRAGTFTGRLRVYGRAGEPCPRCGTPVRRDVVRLRSTFWCPGCQL